MRFGRLLFLVLVWLVSPALCEADVVFPARLQINEIEPGTYEVTFTLPLVEGRILRAQPILPPACREVTERQIDRTSTGVTRRWRVDCEPSSLEGQAILIEGLLGTQTDLLLEVGTLDGRLHRTVLKPSRPGIIVPSPPTLLSLAGESLIAGMRRVVRYVELWVLVLVMICVGARRTSVVWGLVVFAGAHPFGQWVASRNGLLISSHLPPAFVLLTALVPALDLARGEQTIRGWLRPFGLLALFLGLLYGGARPETVPAEGLSTSEQVAGSIVFTVGIGFGLMLIATTLLELRKVVRLGSRDRPMGEINRSLGYIAGIMCVGLLLHRATALWWVPTGMPRAPVELAMLAVVLGMVIAAIPNGYRSFLVLPFAALLVVGLALGLSGIPVPLGTTTVYGSLFLFGVLLLLAKALPARLAWPLGALAVIGQGWHTGQSMVENVSLPIASALGAGVVAVCIFYASFRLAKPIGRSELALRVMGAAVAFLALAWRMGEYYRWLDGPVATEVALGSLRLPLLALLLLLATAFVWPRKRRVLAELGVKSRSSTLHWVLLGLSFFLIRIGTLAAPNPFFEPRAPRGEDARRVVSQVLWNTYHAFNLTDEDELYDRLSQNVTGDLVADLYLDSRRRLTAGTREGAEVTVRDVSVVEVDDSAGGSNAEAGFSYACRWIVTARVRHLQHVHHRQNIYNGSLTIRVEGDRWKIARVELTSEDRVVLPWQPT